MSLPLSGRAAQRHRVALLALLATQRGRPLSRDRLIGYLWPETTQERARHLLSDAIYHINRAAGTELIIAAGDDVRLDTTRATSDVGEFEDAFDRGDYEDAAGAFGGALLDGFFLPNSEPFEGWVTAERERLRRRYASALEHATNAAVARNDGLRAVEFLRGLLAAEPFSSRAALRLMTELVRVGDPGAAVRVALEHEMLLKRELDVELPAELRALVEEIKTAPPPATAPAQKLATMPPVAPDTAPVVLPLPPLVHITSWHRRHVRALAAVALVVLVAGGFFARREMRRAPLAPSIAVLPFANLSGTDDRDYIADGLTEELINSLSRLPGLQVAARTSSFQFRDRNGDVRAIAQSLRVANVLEGSMRAVNGRIKVSVQLINAANGYEVWSDSFERDENDVLRVQEDVARAIVARLRGQLLPAEAAAIASVSVDPQAYNLYLRGRFHWHRRTSSDLQLAIRYFERALQAAPRYPRAWEGLAHAFAISGYYDYLPPDSAFPRARDAARRALRLDAQSPAAHVTLAYVALYYEWDFPRAEEHFRRALRLDPSYSTAHQWYGNLLTAAGRFDEAAREMRRASELDPLSLIANTSIGWTHYFARDYAAADRQFASTLALDSTFQLAHLWRGWALEAGGDASGALAAYEKALTLDPSSLINRAAVARGYAITGQPARARQLLASSVPDRSGYAPWYEFAKVELALGNSRAALDLLERAAAARAHSIAFVHVDPQLDVIRSHPRFVALARAVRR